MILVNCAFFGIEVDSSSSSTLYDASVLLNYLHVLTCSSEVMLTLLWLRPSAYICCSDGDFMSNDEATQHRKIVSGLQYLTLIQPDLSVVVNKVCQYLHEYRSSHWPAIKRILGYVRFTIDSGHQFRSSSYVLLTSLIGLSVQMIGGQPRNILIL
jgi:hypothetical protein